jgi:Derlin-2/3
MVRFVLPDSFFLLREHSIKKLRIAFLRADSSRPSLFLVGQIIGFLIVMLGDSPVSYLFIGVSLLIIILIHCHVINVYNIYYNRDLIFEHGEIWRLLTSLLYFGPLGFNTFLHLAAFIQYMGTSESSYFSTKPGDFLLFCLFGMTALWIYSFFCPLLFLGSGFMSYFLYYSSKRAPDNQMLLFILPIPVRAPYIPLLLLGLTMWYREYRNMMTTLVGYGAAHLYFFVKDVIGLRFDLHLLTAPQWANDALNRLLHP